MEKGNDTFHFKQFSVKHNPNVFRINTDGCLLGALLSIHLLEQHFLINKSHRILDIGTGTGVIALMVAQHFKGYIDAIDINPVAVELAAYNFSKCDWKERLHAFHTDLSCFADNKKNIYYRIVSNPPFFSNSLKSPHQLKNQAKHNDILTLETLCKSAFQLLLPNGLFYIILPPEEAKNFIKISTSQKLYLQSIIYIKSVEYKRVFRNILIFSKFNNFNCEEKTIVIQQKNGNYTAEYKALTKDFFLNF